MATEQGNIFECRVEAGRLANTRPLLNSTTRKRRSRTSRSTSTHQSGDRERQALCRFAESWSAADRRRHGARTGNAAGSISLCARWRPTKRQTLGRHARQERRARPADRRELSRTLREMKRRPERSPILRTIDRTFGWRPTAAASFFSPTKESRSASPLMARPAACVQIMSTQSSRTAKR